MKKINRHKKIISVVLGLLLLRFLFGTTISPVKHDEDFYLSPEEYICPRDKNPHHPYMIAFVNLAPHYFDKRMVIRETWGNNDMSPLNFKKFFIIGMSNDTAVNAKILDEYNIYHDILQLNNYIDSYFTMTYKVMKSLQWISKHCTQSSYVLRINDDVMLNTLHMVEYFKSLDYQKGRIFANVRKSKLILIITLWLKLKIFQNLFNPIDQPTVRDKNSKFYISPEEYNNSILEDYPQGILIFMIKIKIIAE